MEKRKQEQDSEKKKKRGTDKRNKIQVYRLELQLTPISIINWSTDYFWFIVLSIKCQ